LVENGGLWERIGNARRLSLSNIPRPLEGSGQEITIGRGNHRRNRKRGSKRTKPVPWPRIISSWGMQGMGTLLPIIQGENKWHRGPHARSFWQDKRVLVRILGGGTHCFSMRKKVAKRTAFSLGNRKGEIVGRKAGQKLFWNEKEFVGKKNKGKS